MRGLAEVTTRRSAGSVPLLDSGGLGSRTASPLREMIPPWLRVRLHWLSAFCAVAALWLFTHVYAGVRLDSRIYIGRALADLSPGTVGQDLMFRHDGQSPFSVFTLLARICVGQLGPQAGAAVLAFAAMCLWFAAMTAFVHRVAKGWLPWAMLACVAVLPCEYGGLTIIPFGEALALPRPFAEAGVLAALAAMLDGRRLLPLALLLAASLFHPIMALCGFGVFFAVTCWEDRRWIVPVALLGVAVLAAGALGLPLASRLFQQVDRDWLDLLHRRNPYLFTSFWPLSSWSQTAVQLTTTAIAAWLLEGRARRVYAAAAGVAVAGIAATWLFGDVLANPLVLQAQPWRALWLPAALGASGFALVAARLWRAGPDGQIVLSFLTLGWLAIGSPAGLIAALMALALFTAQRRLGRLPLGRPVLVAAWGLVLLSVAAMFVHTTLMAVQLVGLWPKQAGNLDVVVAALNLQVFIVTPLAVWLAVGRSEAQVRTLLVRLLPLSLALLAVALVRWDRAPFDPRPGPGYQPELVRLLAERPGPILWIDGDTEAWMLAGRPAWASEIQGASIVFARDPALAWQARMRRLLALKLIFRNVLTPWAGDKGPIIEPSSGALSALCASPDGPAWIVAHILNKSAPLPPNTKVWRTSTTMYLRDGERTWRPVDSYALTRCDGPAGAARPTP